MSKILHEEYKFESKPQIETISNKIEYGMNLLQASTEASRYGLEGQNSAEKSLKSLLGINKMT